MAEKTTLNLICMKSLCASWEKTKIHPPHLLAFRFGGSETSTGAADNPKNILNISTLGSKRLGSKYLLRTPFHLSVFGDWILSGLLSDGRLKCYSPNIFCLCPQGCVDSVTGQFWLKNITLLVFCAAKQFCWFSFRSNLEVFLFECVNDQKVVSSVRLFVRLRLAENTQ